MNQNILLKHKLYNNIQLYALFILLSSLIIYVALIIGGEMLVMVSLLSMIFLYFFNPTIASRFILRMYNAQLVPYSSAPALYELIDIISERAGLSDPPKLYYIPSGVINSFAVGRSNSASIAVSDGVLKNLTYEEIAGILGHEISHISSDDIRVMTFADISGRIVKALSVLGQLVILISLPLTLLNNIEINWLPFIIVIFSPIASDLIQLGVSRVREYEADIGSAMLLGDARPLVSALKKIDDYEHNYFRSMFSTALKIPEPSLLRTHPKTEERIRRLLAIQTTFKYERIKHNDDLISGNTPHHHIELKERKPRRHINGFWY